MILTNKKRKNLSGFLNGGFCPSALPGRRKSRQIHPLPFNKMSMTTITTANALLPIAETLGRCALSQWRIIAWRSSTAWLCREMTLVAAIVDVLADLTGATCTLSACAANSQFHRSIERCVLALLGKQHGSPSNTFRVLAKHLLRLMTDTGGKGAVNRAREAAFEFSSPPWKTPR